MNLDSHVDRFIDEVGQTASRMGAMQALTEFGSCFGFEGSCFVLMPRTRNLDRSLPVPLAVLAHINGMNNRSSAALYRYYVSHLPFFDQDPLYLVCEHTALPFRWTYDLNSIRVIGANAPFTAAHIARARMSVRLTEICAGVTAPFRLPFGQFGYVTLLTSAPGRVECACAESMKDQLLVVAYRFHDAISKHIPPGRNLEITLRQRELECLHLAAMGKSIRQTADLLGISFSTVRFHMQNAERKLGVSTRSSAIATAVSLGLIHYS